MRYTKLGSTGLEVSSIALGAMTYGEPGRGYPAWSLTEEDSRPLIEHAVEAGINFFDTANWYSLGSSEEILGRALKDYADRDNVVVCTKIRHAMRPGPSSIMPEGLLKDLSDQQVRDLFAYLRSTQPLID